MVTKINRKQTIWWVIILFTLLIVASSFIVIMSPINTDVPTIEPHINQPYTDVYDTVETTCNWSEYKNPDEFHRIYY